MSVPGGAKTGFTFEHIYACGCANESGIGPDGCSTSFAHLAAFPLFPSSEECDELLFGLR
jgi:hypothetical protein